MRVSRYFVVLAVLALPACQSISPHVTSTLVSTPELLNRKPSDVAILPVEDATPDGRLRPWRATLREALALGLVSRLYSPLSPDKVDAVFQSEGATPRNGTAVDAGYLSGLAGKFGEDALLAVRFTRWDESSLMSNARLRFACDVTMVHAQSGRTLWSGGLEGEVKSGGYGPAPLSPEARAEDAARQVALEIVGRLPKRQP